MKDYFLKKKLSRVIAKGKYVGGGTSKKAYLYKGKVYAIQRIDNEKAPMLWQLEKDLFNKVKEFDYFFIIRKIKGSKTLHYKVMDYYKEINSIENLCAKYQLDFNNYVNELNKINNTLYEKYNIKLDNYDILFNNGNAVYHNGKIKVLDYALLERKDK